MWSKGICSILSMGEIKPRQTLVFFIRLIILERIEPIQVINNEGNLLIILLSREDDISPHGNQLLSSILSSGDISHQNQTIIYDVWSLCVGAKLDGYYKCRPRVRYHQGLSSANGNHWRHNGIWYIILARFFFPFRCCIICYWKSKVAQLQELKVHNCNNWKLQSCRIRSCTIVKFAVAHC